MAASLTKLIISAEAGSLFDKVGHAVGEGLQRTLGRPLSFENFGDSGGVGGAEAGARAPRDGSTILICNKGALTSHPHTAKTYRTADFIPLCQVAEAPIAVAVGCDSPFKTLNGLFEAARNQPETISYSTPNPYHTQRLAMQDFAKRQGIDFKFMVLPGGNAASIKHLSDETVHFAFLAAHNLVSPEKAGEIRILGVAHESRLLFLPTVLTFSEQGFDLVTAIWLGLFAPVGVSAGQVAELKQLATATMSDHETVTEIERLNVVPAFIEPAEFQKKVSRDADFHLNVLRELGAV